MNQTIKAFIDGINAHDVDRLGELMADDHTFIDAHGNQVVGKEKMIPGWRGYFDWFPDYYVKVTDVFEREGPDDGQRFAMLGIAGGSFKGKPDANWELPAAWKVIVKDNRVTLWQVFADTKIPFEIMERST